MNILGANNENGRKGEDLATDFLLKKGYFIVAKNWRSRRREIDIITQLEEFIVFVEVKTRIEGGLMDPEEAMTRKKQKLLIKAANDFYRKYRLKHECRYDVIAVRIGEERHRIEHYPSAFYPRP